MRQHDEGGKTDGEILREGTYLARRVRRYRNLMMMNLPALYLHHLLPPFQRRHPGARPPPLAPAQPQPGGHRGQGGHHLTGQSGHLLPQERHQVHNKAWYILSSCEMSSPVSSRQPPAPARSHRVHGHPAPSYGAIGHPGDHHQPPFPRDNGHSAHWLQLRQQEDRRRQLLLPHCDPASRIPWQPQPALPNQVVQHTKIILDGCSIPW